MTVGELTTIGNPARNGAFGSDGRAIASTTVAAGNGGAATSTSEGVAEGNSAVRVFDIAVGGRGGNGSGPFNTSGGIGGSGGAASSSAAARNAGASAVTARAEAYGGTAGLGGSEGDPGDAESNAHAVGLGEVLASAVARAGATSTYSSLVDSTALANATGAGSSGMASALAESASNLTRTTFVTTRAFASATVLEDATATARSVRNGQLSPDDLAIAADAAALVTAGGTETTVWGSAALVLADDQLRDDGSITLHAEADFTGIAQPGALEAGVFVSFLAFELDETDFESLSFRIDNGAQAVLERIFQDAASALAFFTGPALELENLAGMITVAGQFDLRFNLDLVSSRAGDRVGALFALGTAPVPEPGTGALLALGLIAIAARRGRTRPRSAARLFAMV